MKGVTDKVKQAAHKMGVGHTEGKHHEAGAAPGSAYEEDRLGTGGAGAQPIGSSYENVGATYGAAAAPGIAAPVVPPSTVDTRAGEEPGAYVQQTTATTTTGAGAAAPIAAATGAGETCAQEHFTKVEDRPVVKERVEQVLEHKPVEKEFVVETRATGAEREAGVGEVEHLGTTERVVGTTLPKGACE